jgi:putative transcriptional regulator
VRLALFLVVVLCACFGPFRAPLSAESRGSLPLTFHEGAGSALALHQNLDLPPAKGRFLVAAEKMGDPRFAQTVVLLVEHGQSGAQGLIINRPTEMKLSEALPDMDLLAGADRTVYFGGPVDVTRLTILIQSDEEPADSAHVFKEVYVAGSRKSLERLLSGESGSWEFRAYAGYAGWAPQQLEREIAAGGWYVTEADTASVFLKEASRVWPDMIRQFSVLWVLCNECRTEAMVARFLPPKAPGKGPDGTASLGDGLTPLAGEGLSYPHGVGMRFKPFDIGKGLHRVRDQ